jgi:hypothetical protein
MAYIALRERKDVRGMESPTTPTKAQQEESENESKDFSTSTTTTTTGISEEHVANEEVAKEGANGNNDNSKLDVPSESNSKEGSHSRRSSANSRRSSASMVSSLSSLANSTNANASNAKEGNHSRRTSANSANSLSSLSVPAIDRFLILCYVIVKAKLENMWSQYCYLGTSYCFNFTHLLLLTG